jgi:hypothetical protein
MLPKCNTYVLSMSCAKKNVFIIFFKLASGLLYGPNDVLNYL